MPLQCLEITAHCNYDNAEDPFTVFGIIVFYCASRELDLLPHKNSQGKPNTPPMMT